MLKEKLFKLKQLGISVEIINSGYDYNTIKINPHLSENEVEKIIDEKIKFVEDRPWLNEVKSMGNDCSYNICLSCTFYQFVLQYSMNGETTIENCSCGHFQKIEKERHKPITVCNTYQLKK